MPQTDEASALPLQPLRILPTRVNRFYDGGAEIDRLRGVAYPHDTTQPEEWVGSTTEARPGTRGGPGEGVSNIDVPGRGPVALPDLVAHSADVLLGPAHLAQYGPTTALLVKLLDASSRLPVHAHPDRTFATQYLGSPYGKTEAWLILGTRAVPNDRPHILLGLREGVSEATFRAAVRSQDTAALVQSLNRIDVAAGDVYYVRAGVPHAIGAGVFMVEVQEPTDFSIVAEYTGFPIDPDRAHLGLGWELALDAFDYTAFSRARLVTELKRMPRTLRQTGGNLEQIVIETEFFAVQKISLVTDGELTSGGLFGIAIVTRGSGELQLAGGHTPVRAGDAFLLPAAMPPTRLTATPGERLELLRCQPGSVSPTTP